ncbi:unnamed protein product, partial [Heterotrigona itama]
FWMTAWTETNIFGELETLFKNKKLKAPPHKLVPCCQYQEAVINAIHTDGRTEVKYILDMTKS